MFVAESSSPLTRPCPTSCGPISLGAAVCWSLGVGLGLKMQQGEGVVPISGWVVFD